MKRLHFLTFLLAILTSCVRTISYDPEEVEDRPIMNAHFFAGDSVHTVYAGVSRTNTVTGLRGAEIRCLVNGELASVSEEDTQSRLMQTPYRIKAFLRPGDVIRLEMSSAAGDAWCTATVPEPCGKINGVRISEQGGRMNISIDVEDISGDRSYYMLRCRHRYDRDVRIFISEHEYEHRKKHFEETLTLSHTEDPILDGAYLGSGGDTDILGTEVQNVYNIFSDRKFSQAKATINVSVPREEAYSTGLDYEVYLENDIIKTVHWLDFFICSISKEEYDYLSAISTLKAGDFDASYLMEAAVIPSNVNGGEGFFSAYSENCYAVDITDL